MWLNRILSYEQCRGANTMSLTSEQANGSRVRLTCIINWRACVDQRSERRMRKYMRRWHWLRMYIWMEPLIWVRVNASIKWWSNDQIGMMMNVLTFDGSATEGRNAIGGWVRNMLDTTRWEYHSFRS